ncbi:MAG: YlbF family regulator [Clostridia bacterium]|nr:YlbF family regulator [Clostridia bacterium]
MPEEVTRAADALLDALKNTEAFRQYDALKETVLADEVNRRLLERFMRAQSALQLAAMAGSEPREEDAAEFEKLSTLLYESPEITDYLLAQMKVQQLVAHTMEKITREAGIQVDFPEA